MNIMIFARVLAKTGIGRHIDCLTDKLQQQGHNVILLTGRADFELRNKKVECFFLNVESKNPIVIKRNLTKIKKILQEKTIDIVHCHHRIASLYMKILNKKINQAFIYTLHSMSVPTDFFHKKLTFYGKKAIGVSSGVCRFLNEKLNVPKQDIQRVLNGVETKDLTLLSDVERNEQKETWGISKEKIIFAIHSRIEPVKNHEMVVDAISRLSEDEKNKIVVLCSGDEQGKYYRKIVKKIRKENLEGCFKFVGWSDTRQILGVADYLLLPSISEGCSLTALEAFFMKVPVISTKTGAFEELQYCIPIVPPIVIELENIVKDIIHNNTNYEEITQKAYDLANEKFTVERMTNEILEVYRLAIGVK